jgi:hypothetical protein
VAALAIELSTMTDTKQTPIWRFLGKSICNSHRRAANLCRCTSWLCIDVDQLTSQASAVRATTRAAEAAFGHYLTVHFRGPRRLFTQRRILLCFDFAYRVGSRLTLAHGLALRTEVTSIGARLDGRPSFSIPAASECRHYSYQLP